MAIVSFPAQGRLKEKRRRNDESRMAIMVID
jgi:hypothetical protein